MRRNELLPVETLCFFGAIRHDADQVKTVSTALPRVPEAQPVVVLCVPASFFVRNGRPMTKTS